MSNRRVYYAVSAVAVSKCGEMSFTNAHGVQSVAINTRFNLLNIFELGQIDQYQIQEDVPDIELTAEKVLDGYPLLYHLATKGAISGTLAGRSNIRSTWGFSVFTDTQ